MITKIDFTVKRKEDGKEFDMIVGCADSKGDIPRYYIGTLNNTKWHYLESIDGMEAFYELYEVIDVII